jgi:hypothetical protein
MKALHLLSLASFFLVTTIFAQDVCNTVADPNEKASCQKAEDQLAETRTNILNKYAPPPPAEKPVIIEKETSRPPEAGPIESPEPEATSPKPGANQTPAPAEKKPLEHYNIFQ